MCLYDANLLLVVVHGSISKNLLSGLYSLDWDWQSCTRHKWCKRLTSLPPLLRYRLSKAPWLVFGWTAIPSSNQPVQFCTLHYNPSRTCSHRYIKQESKKIKKIDELHFMLEGDRERVHVQFRKASLFKFEGGVSLPQAYTHLTEWTDISSSSSSSSSPSSPDTLMFSLDVISSLTSTWISGQKG